MNRELMKALFERVDEDAHELSNSMDKLGLHFYDSSPDEMIQSWLDDAIACAERTLRRLRAMKEFA